MSIYMNNLGPSLQGFIQNHIGIFIIGCLFSTHCGHSDMNLGFSEPDIRDDL
jgi:hypothetical protein